MYIGSHRPYPVRTAQRAILREPVQQGQRGGRAAAIATATGPVERHHRRVLDRQQLVVQGENRTPVSGGERGCGRGAARKLGLQQQRPELAPAGKFQRAGTVGDQLTIPLRAVLRVERVGDGCWSCWRRPVPAGGPLR